MNRLGHQIVGTTSLGGLYYFAEKNIILTQVFSFENLFLSLIFIGFFWVGTFLPDLDNKLSFLFDKDTKGDRRYLYHRQITHSILLWGFIFYYGFFIETNLEIQFLLLGLSLGVFTHLLADSITGSVPLFLYASYKKQSNLFLKLLNLRIGIKLF